jgi:hypothetical protein
MLTVYDNIGLDFEHQVFNALRASGLSNYLTFKNPINQPDEWKRQIGHGCDFKLQLPNGKKFNIEAKYMTSDYPYRVAWFYNDVTTRFSGEGYDPNTINIVVTNRPANLAESKAVKAAVKRFAVNIRFITITELLSIVTTTLQEITKIIKRCVTYINNYSYSIDELYHNVYKSPLNNIISDKNGI